MFSSSLLNPPQQDPVLLVAPLGLGSKYLMDCGDLHATPRGELMDVRRIFISHAHIDHFIGFDQLLRMQLFADHTLHIYGPPPMASLVRSKLQGYVWNLTSASPFQVMVHELYPDRERVQLLSCARRFRPLRAGWRRHSGRLPLDAGIQLRWCPLVHGVDCYGYRLDWPPTARFHPERSQEAPGPWVTELKARFLRGEIPEHPALSLQPGPSLCYIADTRLDPDTLERLGAFASGASQLWCEATYDESEADKAAVNLHATAAQAARLAAKAGVARLHLFHFSRRYLKDESPPQLEEARAIFPATVVGPVLGTRPQS